MVIAGGPIGRIPAQRLARAELAKGMYGGHESFLQWLYNQLERLYNAVGNSIPGGWWATVAMAAIVVLIVVVVRAAIGPVARNRRRLESALLGGTDQMTAREHHDLARRHAEDGDFSGAIIERVRAIAADLTERALLVPGPARTADELASEAGALFPAHAAELAAAAQLFDEVCYGDRAGTADGYARVQRLDEDLSRVRATAR
jgi:hypothetical protein